MTVPDGRTRESSLERLGEPIGSGKPMVGVVLSSLARQVRVLRPIWILGLAWVALVVGAGLESAPMPKEQPPLSPLRDRRLGGAR